MMEEKQGAAEWLRDFAQRKCNCHEVVRMFGFACGESPCTECIPRLVGAIAQRIEEETGEPQLPEGVEWPRFEDGELVKIRDDVEFNGEAAKVLDVAFSAERFSLGVGTATASGRVYGDFGERVNRPTPKVLDADGAPINVGDTVYCDAEDEPLTVTYISGADGGYCSVTVKHSDGMHCTVDAPRLSHERPDSWLQLSNDTRMGAVKYVDKILGVNIEETTTNEDYEAFARDIMRRAKALAKAGEGL